MKKSKNLIYLTTIFLFLIADNASSQIVDDFYNFSSKNKLVKMKTYYFKDKKYSSVKQQIIYLGTIISKDKKSFKVFTSFINLGGKGNSKLIFVSPKGKTFKYYLDLPTDMPFKIFSNKLFFKNEKTKEVKSIEIDTLREVFCTPFECF